MKAIWMLIALAACSPRQTLPDPALSPTAAASRLDEQPKPVVAKPTIFGVQLGEPLISVDCSKFEFGHPTKGHCVHQGFGPKVSTKTKDGELSLQFPFPELPGWVSGARMKLDMVDGKVERIFIITNGAAAQLGAKAALIAKFGAPTSEGVTPMQNGFGAKFEGLGATWAADDWSISFTGISAGSDKGFIDASTSKGASASRARYLLGHQQRSL